MLFDLDESEEDDFFEVDEPENAAVQAFEILPPRAQEFLIGHKDIEARLLDLFESGRNPHALIFNGPLGIGKSTMAFRLARYLLKKSEDDYNDKFMGAGLFGEVKEKAESLLVAAKDPVFSRIAASGHPDLLTIERLYDEKKDKRKTEVAIDEIRKIAPFMRKTPAIDGGWRIVVVDDADMMNRNSQNSILKILEEPPEKALLILVTHRIGALLPTILSRASVIPFYPLAHTELNDFLQKARPSLSEEDRHLVLDIAEGSIGRALMLSETDNYKILFEALSLFESWPQFDWTKIQRFADTLGRGATEAAQHSFVESLNWLSTSLLKAKSVNAPLNSYLKRFQSLYDQVSLAGWLQICDSIQEHFTRVQVGNLDKKFAVLGAFTIFENNA